MIAFLDDRPLAYGSLVFQSRYPPFKEAKTPEISDLVVAEQWQRRGLATRLVCELQSEAERRGYRRIGLGVGLYAEYGPAQILYSKLGFILDGGGLTVGPERQTVKPGATVKVDDDLLLWLTKPVYPTNP